MGRWGGGQGGRGAEAQEIRGREAGKEKVGSRSSKRAGSREKCEMLNILIYNVLLTILSKTSTKIIFHLHATSFQSLLRLPSKRANEQTKFALGLKNRLTSGETVH